MVTELRWLDLDPETHAFEPRAAEPRLRRIVAAAARSEHGRRHCETQINDAILETHGAWAGGWCWAPNEPGGGGPSRGWCCSRDSVLRDDDASPETTVERALGALASWREFLEELARRFATMRVAGTTVEHAAAELLPYILDRTSAEDAWYRTFAASVAWFAEPLAGDVEKMRGAVHALVSGRFESWMTPNEPAQTETFRALGDLVDGEPVRDATAAWLAIRSTAFERLPEEPRASITGDGHQHYIDTVDRTHDPVRAERLTAALEMCRASARSGLALSLGQLAEWQAIVLGASQPVELRTGDALAKAGRERYPWTPELRDTLEGVLADAADSRTHPAVRAARAYLDVCFLHPFPDGNARAARLALDHVLTGAGLALRAAGPVFRLSRAANDGPGAASFARVIDRLAGPLV